MDDDARRVVEALTDWTCDWLAGHAVQHRRGTDAISGDPYVAAPHDRKWGPHGQHLKYGFRLLLTLDGWGDLLLVVTGRAATGRTYAFRLQLSDPGLFEQLERHLSEVLRRCRDR